MSNYLYIDGQQVDLDKEIPMPISYSIGDFKNPENRRRSVSKTIRIPGTQRNKRIFASAYNLSLTNEVSNLGFDFNPNIKVGARYLRNGKSIFIGLVRLLSVKINGGAYEFEIVLFSDLVNIVKQMNDVNVSELDWSEYDHVLGISTVADSWSTGVMKNGSVTSNYTGGKPDGFGYWYPIIEFGYNNLSVQTINIENLVPYLYVKETFEKCFKNIGYTLESSFLDEDMTKSLTWGFGGGDKTMLPPLDLSNRQVDYDFDYSMTSNTYNSYTFGPRFPSQLFGADWLDIKDFNGTLIADSYLQFDSSTGSINCMRTGTYNLNLDFDTLVSYNVTSGIASNNGSEISTQVFRNGVKVGVAGSNYRITPSTTTYSLNADVALNLIAGDVITVKYEVFLRLTDSSPFSAEFSVDLNNAFNLNFTSKEGVYALGDTITLNRFIPKMKCGDFVKGVINMFNLYVSEPDEFDVIKIEPLSQFYSGEENWTNKLDHSREIEIKPTVNDSPKIFAFKFAEDKDRFSENYFNAQGVRYGDYTYTSDNEYNTKETVFQLPFAQSIPSEVLPGFVIPNITKLESGVVEPYEGKARIFFNNGLKPMGGWSLNTGTNASPTLTNYLSYPQAHHSYGNIKNATFDLNFSKPEFPNYIFNRYSNNNLFNKYQRINILEQTSIDGKVLKAYFNLDSNELTDFGKLVNINGVLYRKNIIENFDANGNETTKVELYKVIEITESFITSPLIEVEIPYTSSIGLTSSPILVGEGVPKLSGGTNGVMRENKKIHTIYERV